MQLTIPNTFANGTGPSNIIDAPSVNANFTAIATVLNGNIEKDNIKSGSAICLNDTAMTISAAWTFSTNPVFNAGGIADSALTSNIPRKDTTNTFTAKQTFNAGIDLNLQQAENLKLELLASLPAWQSSDKGRLVYALDVNKAYVGLDSAWKEISYVGDYTGGAIRAYSSITDLDDGDSIKLFFKTEGGSPTVKISIKGEPFPKRFYTELGEHNHTFTGTPHNHGITDGGHTHQVVIGSHAHGTTQYALSTHTHGISGNTGNQAASHKHALTGGVATAAVSSEDISHTHAAGTLAGPSHTHGAGTLTGPSHTHPGSSLNIDEGTPEHTHDDVTTGAGQTGQPSGSGLSFEVTGNTGAGGDAAVTGSSAAGGTGAVTGSTAMGGSATHSHSLSGVTDVQDASHVHAISLTSDTPSASQAIESENLGTKTSASSTTGISVNNQTAAGTIGNKGVSGGTLSTAQKLYGKYLTVKIDGTNVTANVKTATGWSNIGDGTSGHAFHTAGSGEMDASSWVSYTPGFHTLEIIEPEGGFGCRVMIHIETS